MDTYCYMAIHKHNTLLYQTVLLMTIFEGSAGAMLSRLSCVQGKRSAFHAGRWLAQGWVYTSSTRLASSSTSLNVASGKTNIQKFYRS